MNASLNAHLPRTGAAVLAAAATALLAAAVLAIAAPAPESAAAPAAPTSVPGCHAAPVVAAVPTTRTEV